MTTNASSTSIWLTSFAIFVVVCAFIATTVPTMEETTDIFRLLSLSMVAFSLVRPSIVASAMSYIIHNPLSYVISVIFGGLTSTIVILAFDGMIEISKIILIFTFISLGTMVAMRLVAYIIAGTWYFFRLGTTAAFHLVAFILHGTLHLCSLGTTASIRLVAVILAGTWYLFVELIRLVLVVVFVHILAPNLLFVIAINNAIIKSARTMVLRMIGMGILFVIMLQCSHEIDHFIDAVLFMGVAMYLGMSIFFVCLSIIANVNRICIHMWKDGCNVLCLNRKKSG